MTAGMIAGQWLPGKRVRTARRCNDDPESLRLLAASPLAERSISCGYQDRGVFAAHATAATPCGESGLTGTAYAEGASNPRRTKSAAPRAARFILLGSRLVVALPSPHGNTFAPATGSQLERSIVTAFISSIPPSHAFTI